MTTGTLHLIPVTLGGDSPVAVLPASVLAIIPTLSHFVVEHEKSARAFLRLAGHPQPLASLDLQRLAAQTRDDALDLLLSPLLAGRDIGLLSEAGCPGIADPGAALVATAHALGIRVRPHVGPSAPTLALMASGLNGQAFVFHGYLPVAAQERRMRLRALERDAVATGATQIFIETPYRTDAMLRGVLEACAPATRLCLAVDLTLPSEEIATCAVARWRTTLRVYGKRPAIFLLGAPLTAVRARPRA